MRSLLSYTYLTSLSLRRSIGFADPWLYPNKLRNYLSTAFRVRDLTPSTSTIMIVAYILRQFPTICLEAIKGSIRNLPLWTAPRATFEFGTAQYETGVPANTPRIPCKFGRRKSGVRFSPDARESFLLGNVQTGTEANPASCIIEIGWFFKIKMANMTRDVLRITE